MDEDSDNEADYNIYLAEPIEEMLGNLEARYSTLIPIFNITFRYYVKFK